MDGADLTELLGLRHGVLRALVESPRPRHELVDALPDSKSTVYKGLTQLEEAGLVERTVKSSRPVEVEYSLTEIGSEIGPVMETIATWLDEYHEVVEAGADN
jgi:DNA-binding HxlR family transcriptional regulator